MALQLGALRSALLDAGAAPDKADRAAEELAGYDPQLSDLRADLALLKWMVSFGLATNAAILLKLFMH